MTTQEKNNLFESLMPYHPASTVREFDQKVKGIENLNKHIEERRSKMRTSYENRKKNIHRNGCS